MRSRARPTHGADSPVRRSRSVGRGRAARGGNWAPYARALALFAAVYVASRLHRGRGRAAADHPAEQGESSPRSALRGHGAYDLISLTEDARRDTSEGLRAVLNRLSRLQGEVSALRAEQAQGRS